MILEPEIMPKSNALTDSKTAQERYYSSILKRFDAHLNLYL